jgi:hypothetical protein
MDTACQYTASTAQPSGGSATANLSNQTSDRAHFDFWRLDSGHSYAEFAAYVSEAGRRLRSKEPEQGHPEFASLVDSSAVQARATGVLHAGLTTGTYGMACIRWGLAQDAPIDMYPAGPLTVAGG